MRGEPATSSSLHCIRGWDDYWWPDSALFTRAARSAALSTLTTLARTKPPPDRPRACLLRLQLRQLPRSEGSSCRFCLMTVQSTLRREARPIGARCLSRRSSLPCPIGGSLGKHLHRSLALAQWNSADSCEAAVPLRRLCKTRESRR